MFHKKKILRKSKKKGKVGGFFGKTQKKFFYETKVVGNEKLLVRSSFSFLISLMVQNLFIVMCQPGVR